MLPRLFKGVYHFTVYALGILVLTAAVVVTLIRLFLPDIGIYRGEVEAWVGNYMEYPVVMHSLDATWEGWVPHLHLKDIDLMNKAGTQAITHFESAQIMIAPLATLLKRRIVPKQLTINGFELAIARLANGAIYIEGINVSDRQKDQKDNNELAEWLFKQDQIKIKNARIEWNDILHQQKPVQLTDVNFVLRSDGERLQAEGAATLPELYGKQMDFSFDANGDLLSSDWAGELYLAGHDINPEEWYKSYRPLNFVFSGGSANIEVWSTWQKAKLARMEGQLQYADFETRAGDSQLHVAHMDYDFLGERIGDDGWQFHLNLNQFLTDNGDWPEANIVLSATRAEEDGGFRYSASFDYLKLDDFSPFIRNLTFLPDDIKDTLADFSIQGELKQGKFIYDPYKESARRFRFDTQFSQLETDFGPLVPSLSNLSGHLYGYLNQGEISVNSGNVRIGSDFLENKSLQLKSLDGKVSWNTTENSLKLSTDKLRILTDDLSATLSGSLSKVADDNSPFLDFTISVGESDLASLSTYLPRTEKFKLKDWMERSVVGGKLSAARAIFRGRVADFPFDQNNGRFKVIADTSEATLDYSSLWPPIDNIDAEIILDGRKMQTRFRRGQIFNANISSGTASIPDVMTANKTIILDGQIRGSTRDLSLFIEQSPLQRDASLNEIGKSLQGGDMDMGLELNIPIRQPGQTVKVAGNISLSNATLKSSIKNLQLEQVEGNIAFTRSSLNSEVLKATFVDKPVTVLLSGSRLNKDKFPSISIKGSFDKDFVADRLIENFPALESLEYFLRDRISGETEWNLVLSYLPADERNKTVKKLEVDSWLNGLQLDYPEPIGKAHYRARPLHISTYLEKDEAQTVQIKYADILDAELLLDASKKLHTINMHFGSEDQKQEPAQGPGLHLTGTVKKLVTREWWDVIKPRGTEKSKSSNGVLQSGVSVELGVTSLELLGQDFSDTSLSILRPEKNWEFRLLGDEISGKILIPLDRQLNNLISFQLAKLQLKAQQDTTGAGKKKIQPVDIPAIQGTVKEFIYKDMNLGEMSLTTKPLGKGLTVEQISFEKKGLGINGSGVWLNNEGLDTSSFDINLQADKMETMLTTFGYNQTPVKKGETELQLSARWNGSPMDFSLDKLNGTLDMQISKGQMLDINPSAGRLFGLLSLQTLSRRLTLDFSDIFGKGLAFDRIEGSFDIENGNAYTNDLSMSGPSANVAISGRTGLSDQDYDQIVTVTPQLADNLPVAGVLLGPVGIGIGAVVYLAGQMFDSVTNSIDKLLSYQYTITGSWTEPVIEKIKDNKKDPQLSEAAG